MILTSAPWSLGRDGVTDPWHRPTVGLTPITRLRAPEQEIERAVSPADGYPERHH